MSERNFQLLPLEHERNRIKAACGKIPIGLDIDQHVAHMRTALMRANALLRQTLGALKASFAGKPVRCADELIAAAEKYLEGK